MNTMALFFFVSLANFCHAQNLVKAGAHQNFPTNGCQAIYKFPNGFGASVVHTPMSYGNADGLWELAVLGKDGKIRCDTPITYDVLGYLTPEEVSATLDAIAALPPA